MSGAGRNAAVRPATAFPAADTVFRLTATPRPARLRGALGDGGAACCAKSHPRTSAPALDRAMRSAEKTMHKCAAASSRGYFTPRPEYRATCRAVSQRVSPAKARLRTNYGTGHACAVVGFQGLTSSFVLSPPLVFHLSIP